MDVDAELKKIKNALRNKYPKDVVMQLLEDFLKDKTYPLATKYLRNSGSDTVSETLKAGEIIDRLAKLGFERIKTEDSYHTGVEYKGLSFLIKEDKKPYVVLTDQIPYYYIRSNCAQLSGFIREVGDNLPLWADEFESLYSENKVQIEELEKLSWSPRHYSEPISIETMFEKKLKCWMLYTVRRWNKMPRLVF